MPADALPLDPALGPGQRRRRKPPHTEAQRQGVANDQLPGPAAIHVAQRTRAIGNARVQHPAVVRVDVVFRCAVQQHVHVGADVHVARLQGPRERKDQGDVLLLDGRLADVLEVRRRARGEAAGQGGVGVDVELEQVEERVRDHRDGAVEFPLDAVVEFEGLFGLVAHGEGDPLDLVVLGIFYVFAGLASLGQQSVPSMICGARMRRRTGRSEARALSRGGSGIRAHHVSHLGRFQEGLARGDGV